MQRTRTREAAVRRTSWGLAAVLFVVVGCAHAPVAHTRTPTMPAITLRGLPTVYLADRSLGSTPEIIAFRSHARELLERAGARVVDERDAGGATLRAGDLVVRVEQGQSVTSTETTTDSSCLGWAIPLTIVTGTLALVAALTCESVSSHSTTHIPIAVRIFDAEHAAIESQQAADERVARIDTSDRSPILHGDYWLETETSTPSTGPSDALDADRQTGAQHAEQFVAQLLPDLSRAEGIVHRDAPMALDLGVAATAGGETPAPS
jgi:hypothetical protein